MKLSENREMVDNLKQILTYYDYLEYDESCSEGTEQLCIKVSDPNTNCPLGVIETIRVQLGLSGSTCEPEKPTRFYIRIMNYDDYRLLDSTVEYETDRSELNSASAYFERAHAMHDRKEYEFAIEDYKKGFSLETDDTIKDPPYLFNWINLAAAEEEEKRVDRERFYWEYHSKFLERESNRAAVLKRLDFPEWQEKQAKVLARDGKLCVCGDRATEVHHKTYDNVGQELPSDLVALCKNCHDGYHGRLFVKSDSFWHMRALVN